MVKRSRRTDSPLRLCPAFDKRGICCVATVRRCGRRLPGPRAKYRPETRGRLDTRAGGSEAWVKAWCTQGSRHLSRADGVSQAPTLDSWLRSTMRHVPAPCGDWRRRPARPGRALRSHVAVPSGCKRPFAACLSPLKRFLFFLSFESPQTLHSRISGCVCVPCSHRAPSLHPGGHAACLDAHVARRSVATSAQCCELSMARGSH